jgi:hypothetical protein
MPEPVNLDAIKKRLEAATPGPWPFTGNVGGKLVTELVRALVDDPTVTTRYDGDRRLIANAPTDIAALVAEVERLRAEMVPLVEYERMRRIADEQHDKLMSALSALSELAEMVPRSALVQVGWWRGDVLGGWLHEHGVPGEPGHERCQPVLRERQ